MEIIALNHVTFREKALPSLRCKLNCFHRHSKLNVHVVADFCQKTPKFFNCYQNGLMYFFGKLVFLTKRPTLQVLALNAFATFVTKTFEKRLQTGNLLNFHTCKKLIIWDVYCVCSYLSVWYFFRQSPWKVFAKLYWEIYPLSSGFISQIASVQFNFD